MTHSNFYHTIFKHNYIKHTKIILYLLKQTCLHQRIDGIQPVSEPGKEKKFQTHISFYFTLKRSRTFELVIVRFLLICCKLNPFIIYSNEPKNIICKLRHYMTIFSSTLLFLTYFEVVAWCATRMRRVRNLFFFIKSMDKRIFYTHLALSCI